VEHRGKGEPRFEEGEGTLWKSSEKLVFSGRGGPGLSKSLMAPRMPREKHFGLP